MGKDAMKLAIIYAITGVIILISIPVLGKEKVMNILGGTSIEVILMFAMFGIPLGIYAIIIGLRAKGDDSDE